MSAITGVEQSRPEVSIALIGLVLGAVVGSFIPFIVAAAVVAGGVVVRAKRSAGTEH